MKNIFNYEKFLEEANLTISELEKPDPNLGLRGKVLINKLIEHEPIKTADNRDIEIDRMLSNGAWVPPEEAISNMTDDNDEYNPTKAKEYLTKGRFYQKVFKSGNQEFQLNQFQKTTEFGSKGAGRLTRHFESIQIIFLAIRQLYLNEDLRRNQGFLYDIFTEFMERFTNNGRLTPESNVFLPNGVVIHDDLVEEFFENPDWIDTFSRIPNRLWDDRFNYIRTDIEYKIYHVGYHGVDSPYVNMVKKYKEFAREGGYGEIDFAKYCPADAYLIDKEYSDRIIENINNTTTLTQLTRLIDALFHNKLLLPISLKKIKGNNFKIITNREIGKELPEFTIKSFLIGSTMRGIGSKISTTSIWKHRNNKNVDVVDRLINFDSSNTSRKQNVDGEVEGSQSRHGKISFIGIERLLRPYSNDAELDTYTELQTLSLDQLRQMVVNLVADVQALKMHLEDPDIVQVIPILRGRDISTSENKLISRIQSMQIVKAILEIYLENPDAGNELITKILRYALSIQTDKFDTPRYLRVI